MNIKYEFINKIYLIHNVLRKLIFFKREFNNVVNMIARKKNQIFKTLVVTTYILIVYRR